MGYQFLLLTNETKTNLSETFWNKVKSISSQYIEANPLLKTDKDKRYVLLSVARFISHLESAIKANNGEMVSVPYRNYIKSITISKDKRVTVNLIIKELVALGYMVKGSSYKVGYSSIKYGINKYHYDREEIELSSALELEYLVCGVKNSKKNDKKIDNMRKVRLSCNNNISLVVNNSFINIDKLQEVLRMFDIILEDKEVSDYINFHQNKGKVVETYTEWKKIILSRKQETIKAKDSNLTKEQVSELNKLIREKNWFLSKLAKFPYLFKYKHVSVKGKKTKREFHLFTTLPKQLRYCIDPVKGIKVSIDLKNAQPFALLSNNEKNIRAGVEQEVFDAVYHGHFIQLFNECEYFVNKGWTFENNKNDMKPYVYSQVLFASQNYEILDIVNCGKKHKSQMPVWKYVNGYMKDGKWVNGRYPGLATLIKWMDKDNYGKRLATVLQDKEAEVIMPLVNKYLKDGIVCYSIHDNITFYLEDESMIETLAEDMKNKARELFNIPSDVEKIIDIKIGE